MKAIWRSFDAAAFHLGSIGRGQPLHGPGAAAGARASSNGFAGAVLAGATSLLLVDAFGPKLSGTSAGGGIGLQTSDGPGEVRRSPGDWPIFVGLRRGVINLVLTDHIPMKWDNGRALAGVTTIQDGYHVCLIALRYAHGNQVPFISVNTCVHELLHALLQDVFVRRPSWFQTGSREARIDWYATWLWQFHEGAAIRKSAQAYLARLRSSVVSQVPGKLSARG